MKLLQISEKELVTEFLGIVEYSKHYVIGWLEDPHHAVELGAVSLRSPLEFIHKPMEGTRLEVGFVFPKFGIEEERVIEASEVRVICAASDFGKLYIDALKRYWGVKISFSAAHINRPRDVEGL
jgi:hypothetical protein